MVLHFIWSTSHTEKQSKFFLDDFKIQCPKLSGFFPPLGDFNLHSLFYTGSYHHLETLNQLKFKLKCSSSNHKAVYSPQLISRYIFFNFVQSSCFLNPLFSLFIPPHSLLLPHLSKIPGPSFQTFPNSSLYQFLLSIVL